jgi:hypothetical protein
MARDAEMASAGYAKSPFDWYVEEEWVTEALIDAEASIARQCRPFGGHGRHWGIIWDPACGQGSVLEAFAHRIFPTYATDIEFRGYAGGKGFFQELDFTGSLNFVRSAAPNGRFSIVSNPPYSYIRGISEAFVRRALDLATEKVAMLLPIKWQASQARQKLFAEYPPSRIWVLSERPSMPPGAQVAELGSKAFKRGKVDYMWIVWDVRNPAAVGETKWGTIAPREKAVPNV